MSLLSTVKAELAALLDLLFPQACPLCRTELTPASAAGLCHSCQAQLPELSSPRCSRCALPFVSEGGSDHLCEPCLRQPPPFSQVEAVGNYEGLLRDAVHRFKYRGTVQLDRPLATLLAERMEQAETPFRPDLIVPVPLHLGRLRQRGYNQSLLLARQLAKRWRVPVAPRQLVRNRPTPPQQGLSLSVRQQNLRGAFAMTAPLQGETVLLIDDVMTTGATLRECARTLQSSGAGEIVAAVIGRAQRHH
ncbi:ComF family protein [Trichloromonas sp.]|uniref:ComF family protein n=1 Tax=Trichloromonas sp. TaxID=3069249 RepID=UPI003D816503